MRGAPGGRGAPGPAGRGGSYPGRGAPAARGAPPTSRAPPPGSMGASRGGMSRGRGAPQPMGGGRMLPPAARQQQPEQYDDYGASAGYDESMVRQGCGNTMPDLSDLVPFHPGQVENFNLLVL